MEVTEFGGAQGGIRAEDQRALTGGGRYTDDVREPSQAHLVFVRSPVAHGEIRSVDVAAARDAPGVLAVYTGPDLAAAGVAPLSHPTAPMGVDPRCETPRPALAVGRVRYAGDPVAAVVASSRAAAEEAAELVEADVEPLPAVCTVTAALDTGDPPIWDEAPGNVAFEWAAGDAAAVDEAFAKADHVTRVRLDSTRVVGNPIEPRSAVGRHEDGHFTLWASSQGTRYMRSNLVPALGVEPEALRIISRDVGGAFGVRSEGYPDYLVVLHAARDLGRPVGWSGTRSEGFLSDNHGRDGILEGELALDADGRFTALRVRFDAGLGAYVCASGPIPPTRNFSSGLSSVYATPAIHVQSRGVLMNTQPLGPYRGAGRPEAVYLVERLVDAAARETGRDPVEIRRKNMIPADAMPYTTPLGATYDSGDFATVMEKSLELADHAGFPARRAASEAAGKLRGIGIGCFLEIAGGILKESADVRFTDDGAVEVRVAAQSSGQSHHTVHTALVAGRLGVENARVRLVAGDSAESPPGLASVASRGAVTVGGAVALTCDAVVENGRHLAAHFLEAAEADLEFAAGEYRVAGTDRAISILDVAARARAASDLPEGVPESLDAQEEFVGTEQSFPNGCHVCEVEIDPETGLVTVVGYTAVDDCGNVLNEVVVDGQVHGAVTQGLGQVLGEHARFDGEGGLLTGNFLDYFIPRADDVPPVVTGFHPVPCRTNPLGVKGVGEAGTTGALPAGMNAVVDALATRGITCFDMPASPDRVWEALRRAG